MTHCNTYSTIKQIIVYVAYIPYTFSSIHTRYR